MAAVLWVVVYFEPDARKAFELTVSTHDAAGFRPKPEGVLAGFNLEFELLTESDKEVSYRVSAPAAAPYSGEARCTGPGVRTQQRPQYDSPAGPMKDEPRRREGYDVRGHKASSRSSCHCG